MFDCLVMPYYFNAFFFEHCLDKFHSLDIFWHMPEDHTRADFPFLGQLRINIIPYLFDL